MRLRISLPLGSKEILDLVSSHVDGVHSCGLVAEQLLKNAKI